ncbi:MAG: beta-ketoacyl synthase N-terminal-like domain-containing protein [Pseudomonadota bacterium]
MMGQRKRKLGRGVAIVGAGMSAFGIRKDVTNRELFAEAFLDMKNSVDKGVDPKEIESLYIGNCGAEMWESQSVISTLCADIIGLIPNPARKIEDACASSSVAVRDGVIAIASGLYDMVLVGGTEKMSILPINWTTMALACGSDTTFEGSIGFTFPGLYAAMATAHMEKYGTSHDDLLRVAIKNHNNGALNPKAHFPMTIRNVMKMRIAQAEKKGKPIPRWADEMDFLHDPAYNPVIAWPNTLFDCCPITDGAACALLVSEEIAKDFTDTPIYIIGTGHASGHNLHDRDTFTSIPAAKIAAQQAYEMAGVTPQDIKVAEVHDCFTIAEVIAIADLGFFQEGKEAATAAGEGKTARDGIKPVNVSGGLKCKGHPVGATGAAQVVEIFEQMRGKAGERQVTNIDIDLALNHNIGAHGTTAVVQIYERR